MPSVSVLRAVVFSLLVSFALGCSCVFSTFGQRYRASTRVVRARVLAVKVVPPPSPPACLDATPPCLPPIFFPQPVKFTLRLLTTFKGCPPGKVFFGQTASNSAACGINLTKGGIYLLYLGMQKGSKTVPFGLNLCQGNVLFSRLSKGRKRFLRKQSKKKKNMCKN